MGSCCQLSGSGDDRVPEAAPWRRVNAGRTEGMTHLSGGTFLMGSEDFAGFPADGEGPVREVTLSPFWIDTCAVTNAQFAAFVEATGYLTDAERFGWSCVFHLHIDAKLPFEGRVLQAPWWRKVSGSSWRYPEGPGSSVEERSNHPATHLSWNDAHAYARWVGKRLPTEAEWEYAARGGLVGKTYGWGDELVPGGVHRANLFQGKFPMVDTAEDGFSGTCPVDHFVPNGYGLYNMTGNVWEWCHDWFSPDWHTRPQATRHDPHGPPAPLPDGRRVQRGGSYLCHASYCNRYRVAARMGNTADTSAANTGMRCVRDVA